MAPWPTRHQHPASHADPNRSPNSVSPDRSRLHSRISESDLLENAYGIPILPPSAQSTQGRAESSRAAHPSGHGRSMSHPFPSLFSGKKKHTDDQSLSESTDEEHAAPAEARHKAPNSTDNLRTGRCMTCDSMVRWPKELNVFRCTVCLTINDLEPIVLVARPGDGHRVPVDAKAGRNLGHDLLQNGKLTHEGLCRIRLLTFRRDSTYIGGKDSTDY